MPITSGTDIVARVRHRLGQSLGADKYHRYFQDTHLNLNDGVLEITAPNRFTARWIEQRYQEAIRTLTQEVLGFEAELRIGARAGEATSGPSEPARPADPTDAAGQPPAATRDRAAGRPQRGADGAATGIAPPINRRSAKPRSAPNQVNSLRHDLDTFVVGPSNLLAYSSARAMAEREGHEQNPLFIHGGCGLGKTHLLQGLCRRFAQMHPEKQWRYTTAENFTNEYITAIQKNRLGDLRRKLRGVDLLVVDDVHFLANKQATQTEFLHTFDAIDLHGAKIVMASDAAPKLIHQFNEALVSRCVSGMVAEIEPPEADTRQRLVRRLAERRNLRLLDSVVPVIAERAGPSVRDLEGTLTTLKAMSDMEQNGAARDEPIGHTLVGRLFGVSRSAAACHRPVRFRRILEVVCDQLNVETRAVLGNSRHRQVVLARSLAIHLARRLTTLSYPEIARELGRSNHSTAITAAHRIAGRIQAGESVTLGTDLRTLPLTDLVEKLIGRITEPG